MNIPTIEEYKTALNVVSTYETEQRKLAQQKAIEVGQYLTNYFNDTYIKRFTIKVNHNQPVSEIKLEVISLEPKFDEDYGGEFDKDMKLFSAKFDIEIRFEPNNLPK